MRYFVIIATLIITWFICSQIYQVKIRAVHGKNYSAGTYDGYMFALTDTELDLVISKGKWEPSLFAKDYAILPNDNAGPYAIEVKYNKLIWSPFALPQLQQTILTSYTIVDQYCFDSAYREYIRKLKITEVMQLYNDGKIATIESLPAP